jgi:hypothetical protein
MIKENKIRMAGRAVLLGKREMHIKFQLENPQGKDCLEFLCLTR